MKTRTRKPTPRLDEKGYLLEVPENKEFKRLLRATPSLTPEQLLHLSKNFRANPALASLADHLFANAVRMAASTWFDPSHHDSSLDPRMVSFWRKIRTSEPEPEPELTPSDEPPEDIEFPDPGQAPVEICEFKCTWWTVFFIGTGLLWEDCGNGWRVIGVCLSG